jgi:hypothetical protein
VKGLRVSPAMSPVRAVSAFAAMIVVAGAGVAGVATSPAATAASSVAMVDVDGPLSWLAAGDSFSSGEGIPRTTGDCAQSPKAFGPRAAQLLITEKDMDITTVFTACTGAVTTEFFNRPNKSHPTQAEWATDAHGGNRVFDVATMSFGGNDVDFAAVMKRCLDLPPWEEILESGRTGCDVTPEGLALRVTNLDKGIGSAANSGPFGAGNTPSSLSAFYTQVANTHVADGGTLVVVGYPRLIAPSNQWPAWRKGRCGQISAADADMLGDAAAVLDSTMKEAAARADGAVQERSVLYVSRFDLFDHDGDSRSLCAKGGTSWMNGVASLWYAGRLESPFHPNQIGHLATAEKVAAVVHKDLTSNNAPASVAEPTDEPTSEPTEEATDDDIISDGSSTYEIGEPFSEVCSNAWPTAPSRTTTTIEMTMFCPEVPGQFLFVHVSYPDPNLPITPATGFNLIEGEIVDISVSGYGPKSLVVAADNVVLDVS